MAKFDRGTRAPRSGDAVMKAGAAATPGKQTLVEAIPDERGASSIARAPLQRKDAETANPCQASDPASHVHSAAERGISGSAHALPYAGTLERLFGGHNLGSIEAHSDQAAAAGARAMGARAFATGNHIAFASTPDLHTAAHEAAHVVQQRAGVRLSHGVGESDDSYERNADAVADRVVQGLPAHDLLPAPAETGGCGVARAGIQRDPGGDNPQPTNGNPAQATQSAIAACLVMQPDGANVHSAPDAGTSVVATLPQGPAIFSLDTIDVNDWAHITGYTSAVVGWVQAFRLDVFPANDPFVKQVTIPSGTGSTAFALVRDYYGADTVSQTEQDARFFSNVLYYVNEDPAFTRKLPHARARGGFYTEGGTFPMGEVRTNAGQTVWMPSLEFAITLRSIVGTGSFHGDIEAFITKFKNGFPWLWESREPVRVAKNIVKVASAEIMELLQHHLGEMCATVGACLGAEVLAAVLAGTGVGAIGALIIQLLLTALGLYGVVQAGGACISQLAQWVELALDSEGKEDKIDAASQVYCAALISLGLAILAAFGTAAAAAKALNIAGKIGTASAAATDAAADAASTEASNTASQPDQPVVPEQDPVGQQPDQGAGQQGGKLTDVGEPTSGRPIRIKIGSALIIEIMANSDVAEAINFIKNTMEWNLPNDTVWKIDFEPDNSILKSASTNSFTVMKMGAQDMLDLYGELSGLGDKAPSMLWSVTNDTMFNIAKLFGFQQVAEFGPGFMMVAVKTEDLLAFIQANFARLSRIAGR